MSLELKKFNVDLLPKKFYSDGSPIVLIPRRYTGMSFVINEPYNKDMSNCTSNKNEKLYENIKG